MQTPLRSAALLLPPPRSIELQSAFGLLYLPQFADGAASDTEFNTASTFNKLRLRSRTCATRTRRAALSR